MDKSRLMVDRIDEMLDCIDTDVDEMIKIDR